MKLSKITIDISSNNIELLEDNELPVYNFNNKKCKIDFDLIKYFLKKFGIIIFKNFYTKNELEVIKKEVQMFDEELYNCKTTHGTENCSGDFRLFHIEKKSEILKKLVSDNKLFNKIASFYKNPKFFNKKLLLNKLIFDKDNITNSGGGWHRDNHHCQFKTLIYLSDVTEKNGNFRFITNSTIKEIGIPKHWSYDNTRYADETINNLLKDNNVCKQHDIIGMGGTIVFFDPTNIHRGKVIEKGERVALTQYYFT